MPSFMDNLRRAPLKERRELAVTMTFVVVGLVVLIWIVSLGFRFEIFSSEKEPTPQENSGIESPYGS